MKIEIVPATVDHARDLAPRLREHDKDEVWASGGHSPEAALVRSVEASTLAWCALLDGRPEIMWGCAAMPHDGRHGRHGIVWLLSSDEMYRVPGRFMEESFNFVSIMLDVFDSLSNYVHAANVRSQRWLLKLGFHKVGVSENHNGRGGTFILFSRSK